MVGRMSIWGGLVLGFVGAMGGVASGEEGGWVRQTIDDSSIGADGARLRDVNGDGLPDIATGWEEGKRIRVYLHPGFENVRERWAAVTVGEVGSPEDAVLVDLDGDGSVDVVSSCEGKVRTMFAHFAPADSERYLDADAWRTEPFPVTAGASAWMFCLPMEIDGVNGVDLIAGSKHPDGVIGWLRSPESPRRMDDWTWYPWFDATWIMSLEAIDMDGDGDLDLLASDRKTDRSGCLWLENPGRDVMREFPERKWKEQRIGARGAEVMFLDYADVDRDGLEDVIVPVRGGPMLWHRRLDASGTRWETHEIAMPPRVGTGKSVRVTDLDGDGRSDLVVSCENATDGKSGLFWLSAEGEPGETEWRYHEISGSEGVKFDLVQLVDLDGDGDLDVVTCEERDQLGVIWYENPGGAAD